MPANKSQAIRDSSKKLKTTSPKAIIADLKKKRIVVVPAMVSQVLKAEADRNRKPAKGDGVAVTDLVEAKKFARKVGGIDAAIKVLETLKVVSN